MAETLSTGGSHHGIVDGFAFGDWLCLLLTDGEAG